MGVGVAAGTRSETRGGITVIGGCVAGTLCAGCAGVTTAGLRCARTEPVWAPAALLMTINATQKHLEGFCTI
jgi:hypothetical protein